MTGHRVFVPAPSALARRQLARESAAWARLEWLLGKHRQITDELYEEVLRRHALHRRYAEAGHVLEGDLVGAIHSVSDDVIRGFL